MPVSLIPPCPAPAGPSLLAEAVPAAREERKRVSEIVILMPVFRDWQPASLLCQLLDSELQRSAGLHARILLVDDGSPGRLDGWCSFQPEAVGRIDVLRLLRNMGHQRAICTGLCYIHEHMECDSVLVMDADGEDFPDSALRLVEAMEKRGSPVLFAERRKRFESLWFRMGYGAFRTLHRLLTGVSVRVGNFSVVSAVVLPTLVCMPELWSHYAGAVMKSKLPVDCIPMDRGRRLTGNSRMTVSSLLAHGLAGIATFYETVACRLLIMNGIALAFLLLILAVVLAIKLFSNLAIPGWTTYTVGLTAVLFTQLLAISFSLVFSLISNRVNTSFLPKRDCSFYVASFESIVAARRDR